MLPTRFLLDCARHYIWFEIHILNNRQLQFMSEKWRMKRTWMNASFCLLFGFSTEAIIFCSSWAPEKIQESCNEGSELLTNPFLHRIRPRLHRPVAPVESKASERIMSIVSSEQSKRTGMVSCSLSWDSFLDATIWWIRFKRCWMLSVVDVFSLHRLFAVDRRDIALRALLIDEVSSASSHWNTLISSDKGSMFSYILNVRNRSFIFITSLGSRRTKTQVSPSSSSKQSNFTMVLFVGHWGTIAPRCNRLKHKRINRWIKTMERNESDNGCMPSAYFSLSSFFLLFCLSVRRLTERTTAATSALFVEEQKKRVTSDSIRSSSPREENDVWCVKKVERTCDKHDNSLTPDQSNLSQCASANHLKPKSVENVDNSITVLCDKMTVSSSSWKVDTLRYASTSHSPLKHLRFFQWR